MKTHYLTDDRMTSDVTSQLIRGNSYREFMWQTEEIYTAERAKDAEDFDDRLEPECKIEPLPTSLKD
jgi:hypothetical protein